MEIFFLTKVCSLVLISCFLFVAIRFHLINKPPSKFSVYQSFRHGSSFGGCLIFSTSLGLLENWEFSNLSVSVIAFLLELVLGQLGWVSAQITRGPELGGGGSF